MNQILNLRDKGGTITLTGDKTAFPKFYSPDKILPVKLRNICLIWYNIHINISHQNKFDFNQTLKMRNQSGVYFQQVLN